MLINSFFNSRPFTPSSHPFSELEILRRQMDSWLDPTERAARNPGWPKVNLSKDTDGYTLTLAAPGITAKELEIKASDGELTIKGERASTAPDGYKALRRERRPVKFMRRFRLSPQVQTEKIKATFSDGLLTLSLPIGEAHKPRTIQISE